MPREPYRVINLYQNDYLVYGDPDNPHEAYLPALSIPVDSEAVQVKVRAITTGHGQGNTDNAAEFAYKWHAVRVSGESYSHYLWRSDCAQNDCSPQGGTWPLARAGWCPGDKVDPWDIDVTGSVTPGLPAEIDYDIQPYVNQCRPNNPDCADGVTCADCDYNYQGHTEPHFTLQAQVIFYREPLPATVRADDSDPRLLGLAPNRPNPCFQSTTIQYEMDAPGEAIITIWTADGRVVRRLARQHGASGSCSWTWDGRDERGQRLPSGTYFYEVRAGDSQAARKMLLVQ